MRSRLGSLLAVVPLAFWTVNHLWNNLAAFSGAEAWQANVTTYAHPAAQFLTAIVVLLPPRFAHGLGHRSSADLAPE